MSKSVNIDTEPMHMLRTEVMEAKIENLAHQLARIERMVYALLLQDEEAKKKYEELENTLGGLD